MQIIQSRRLFYAALCMFMTLAEIQREIAALPDLAPPAEAKGAETVTPLQIVSKQGRLILRLSASADALEARCREIAESAQEKESRISELTEARRDAEKKARLLALEAIHLMDALDWVQEALQERSDAFAREVAAAQRDCARRLAAAGVTEIPAPLGGTMDGRLHEGLGTASGGDTNAQYAIVSIARRGYQNGTDILRRVGVITAE